MSQGKAVALIAGGEFTRSWFTKLVRRQDPPVDISVVYANSLRVASRIANILRAGKPVASLDAAAACAVLLIRVPEGQVEKLVAKLEKLDTEWKAKTVAVCDAREDSSVLRGLEKLGAHTATLNVHQSGDSMYFVLEGADRAIAVLHRVLGIPRISALRVATGQKGRFWRAMQVAEYVLPLAIAAERELRAAGLAREIASSLIEERIGAIARYYRRAGRKGWKIDWAGALDQMERKFKAP